MRRILFITRGGDLDYENDCCFHGLCSLPETEVCILNESNCDFMFKGLWSEEKRRTLYGKGFTITNLIPPPEKKHLHSREEALENIRHNRYDHVIYGSIFRCSDLWKDVIKFYPRNRILIIDGEDEDFHFRLTRGARYRFFQERKALYYAKHGTYYKCDQRCVPSYLLWYSGRTDR